MVDALTGAHGQTLQGPLDAFNQFPDLMAINSVAWSPDGSHLACASDDTTVRVWRIGQDNQPQVVFVWDGLLITPQTVAWSPTGDQIASADIFGNVQIWEPTGDLWLAH